MIPARTFLGCDSVGANSISWGAVNQGFRWSKIYTHSRVQGVFVGCVLVDIVQNVLGGGRARQGVS